MSAVLPTSSSPRPATLTAPAEQARGAARWPLDHVLESIAAFHTSEAIARQVAVALSIGHGLSPRQVRLLGPDSAWLEGLALRIPRWRKRGDGDKWDGFGLAGIAVALCALLAGLLAAGSLAGQFDSPSERETMPSLWTWLAILGVLGVMLIATLVLTQARRPTLAGKFDRAVQRQLAAGRWAVVVQGVSGAHQAGVLSLLCSGSQCWCASWGSKRRL